MSAQPTCVWDVRAKLGEGPLWSKADQALWFVDIKQNQIHRFDPGSGARRSYEAPSEPGFIVPAEQGGFIVGAQSGLFRFDPGSGGFSLLCAVEKDKPGNRLNDGALDPAGRLWFGTMDNGESEPTGALYRFDKNGLSRIDDGYVITNGPCFSPDGRILYHTDTLPGVTAVRVKDALDAVAGVVMNLVLAVRAASSITLIAAVMVLGGALAAGHRHRVYDAVILKTLGATRRQLMTAYALEYLLLGSATVVFGVAAGSIAGWRIVVDLMTLPFHWQGGPAIAAAVIAVVITMMFGLMGTWPALSRKPAAVLRNL